LYIFCTANGTPFEPRNIVRDFKASLKKAGLPETTRLHDLRHTFVSYLLSQGTFPKDVQEIVGHSSYGVTMDIYGHLMPQAKKDAARIKTAYGLSVDQVVAGSSPVRHPSEFGAAFQMLLSPHPIQFLRGYNPCA